MKRVLSMLLVWISSQAFGQQRIENLILVTTDGLRWQEVFGGMDSAIARDPKFNQDDSALIFRKYWSADAGERRKKLMPFFWSTLAKEGQLYGNRAFGNKVDVSNTYAFSYPGYSELLTGYADTAINTNSYPPNPHVNLLEFLLGRRGFRNSVAAFGAWNAFDRILNEGRAGFPVYSAFDSIGGKLPTARQRLINAMRQDSYKPWNEDECLDIFTHYAAREHLENSLVRVLYIAYGETDEWAHSGQYRSYLDAAHQVDAWIAELWAYVQRTPRLRNKTALLITTDHGRGDAVKSEWTSHGASIAGASSIWFAVIAPGLPAKGEVKAPMQIYQKQLAQTMAELLGYRFTAEHPVAEGVGLR